MNHDGVFAPTVVTSQALVDSSLHTFESRTDIAVDPVWMDEASHGKAKLRLLVIDGMVRRPSSWYFSYLNVCAIELTDGELKVGDTIHVSGKNTDFTLTVGSMQIEHQNINHAEKGKVVGVKVKNKVRMHDQVFAVKDLLGGANGS
jgi:putative protease